MNHVDTTRTSRPSRAEPATPRAVPVRTSPCLYDGRLMTSPDKKLIGEVSLSTLAGDR